MLARYLLSSCVRLSVRHTPVLYLNDWTNRAGFGIEASFHLSYVVLQEIRVSPKIRVLPSETLHQTSDLENFAASSRSR